MNESLAKKYVFPVDANHIGVRLSVILGCVAGFVLAVSVVIPLLSSTLGMSGLIEVLIYVAGILFTIWAIGFTTERIVKHIWPSGKSIELDSEGLSLINRQRVIAITWSRVTSILRWQFKISSNRTWVPKGWHCVAAQVADGDSTISIFAVLSPADASLLPEWEKFVQLSAGRREKGDAAVTDEFSALRDAERHRWEFGAEIDHRHIGQILELIKRNENVLVKSQSV
jgi:hypothetical protein